MLLGKGVLKISSRFTGEYPCQSTISIKSESNFIEIALWHGFSPVELLRIFRTPFPKNTSGRLLLKVTLAAIHLSHTIIISGGHLQQSSIFKGNVFLLNKHLQSAAVIPFFKGIELIHKSSCSHPLHELPFFYYKRVITDTHSFKFTVFMQNRNCSKEILTIIIITPWFQACIYWKAFVSWWNHFQPSIFSMIVSLFHGSTWRTPHVKENVFISQHFLQPSIVTSGLWLIQVCWRVCTYRDSILSWWTSMVKLPSLFQKF